MVLGDSCCAGQGTVSNLSGSCKCTREPTTLSGWAETGGQEGRRAEEGAWGCFSALLKCRSIVHAQEGVRAEVLESLPEPWLLTAAGGKNLREAIQCPRAGLAGHKEALICQGETCISPVTSTSHLNRSAQSPTAKHLVLPIDFQHITRTAADPAALS